ncbi:heme exporter protein CcmD [Turicimonas muris]|uniref:Heme exporter protein D n=2 Tax=Turicimonas muris TaxID=1796652 RepID=A0A227KP90_9BURK|nr:heme exporter protein CcmD [Turicimonas muris]ANU66145.1 heme exporter protein CcmD [Burkholderiales bacterium YL45]MBS4768039.1 heme exporter protein CcmD [Burkholderiales bacterium]MBS4845730.1 heme exporter protein CcmD [Burkholderiales bacterium]OXE49798.1 heme exporter protein CcmD [Turicimonas muris]QQQ97291.1 heme exporter protein CcmD [Turicimonas muris]
MDQWGSFSDFISMGGYGRYVWGAYGMVIFCFICELVSLSRRRQRAAKELLLEARAHQAEEDL